MVGRNSVHFTDSYLRADEAGNIVKAQPEVLLDNKQREQQAKDQKRLEEVMKLQKLQERRSLQMHSGSSSAPPTWSRPHDSSCSPAN